MPIRGMSNIKMNSEYATVKAYFEAFHPICGARWKVPEYSPTFIKCPYCNSSNGTRYTLEQQIKNEQEEK